MVMAQKSFALEGITRQEPSRDSRCGAAWRGAARRGAARHPEQTMLKGTTNRQHGMVDGLIRNHHVFIVDGRDTGMQGRACGFEKSKNAQDVGYRLRFSAVTGSSTHLLKVENDT